MLTMAYLDKPDAEPWPLRLQRERRPRRRPMQVQLDDQLPRGLGHRVDLGHRKESLMLAKPI